MENLHLVVQNGDNVLVDHPVEKEKKVTVRKVGNDFYFESRKIDLVSNEDEVIQVINNKIYLIVD